MANPSRTRLSGRGLLQALLTSAAVLAGSGLAEAGSIRDTVQATLDGNPDIGVVKSNRRAVDQELRQARAGYYPSLDARAAVPSTPSFPATVSGRPAATAVTTTTGWSARKPR